MSRINRAAVFDVLLSLLAVYATAAWAYETANALSQMSRARHLSNAQPWEWHWGMRDVEGLASCVHQAARLTPVDQPLRLWSVDRDWARWRWAAYLQPDRDVQLANPDDPAGAIVFTQETSSRPPRARRIAGGGGCRVFQLHRQPVRRPRGGPQS